MRLVALAAAAVLLALPSAGCSAESASDKAFGEKVRSYLLAHPEVLEEALNRLQLAKTEQTAAATKVALNDHRRELEHDPRDFVAGNPNGAVTVVEFFDYRCPFCKTSAPALEAFLQKNKDVRLVLKEYPVLGPESETAAHVALATKSSGKYLPVHQQLLAEKVINEASVDRVLKANGLNPADVRRSATAADANKHLTDTLALGRTLTVDGTPTFIIGDTRIDGWRPDEIDAAVAAARKLAKP